MEYWCPSEPLQTSTILGSYLGVAHQRPPQRQVSSWFSYFLPWKSLKHEQWYFPHVIAIHAK